MWAAGWRFVPGSFDPLTLGHVDLVAPRRALFDRVVVAILVNEQKTPLLPQAERVELAREVFADVPGVEVDTFDGLLVDYGARRGAARSCAACAALQTPTTNCR